MSYKCICNNGATIGHISGCDDDAGCKACCKGKGGINEDRSGMIVRGQDFGVRAQRQEFHGFSNFMDSNFLEDGTMPDSDRWSNHPGFIGGTWWKDFWSPKAAEKERHNKEQGKVNNSNPFSEDDTCDELDEKIEKLDSQINKISVGGGKERVQSRQLKTREVRRLDIKDMWNKKDCSQQLIDEQAAEFDAKVAKLFGEAQSRVDARSKEDNSLMNVAIGVGVLVVGGVLVLAMRRKKQ